MKIRAVLVCSSLALGATGCSRDKLPNDAAAPVAPDAAMDASATGVTGSLALPPWLGGVKAYATARAMCDEHVVLTPKAGDPSRFREVHWQSYATPDEASSVLSFYERETGVKATVSTDEKKLTLPSGIRLSIYELPPKATFPHCTGNAPASTDRTLIVLHEQTVAPPAK